jgi:hypothetical protein
MDITIDASIRPHGPEASRRPGDRAGDFRDNRPARRRLVRSTQVRSTQATLTEIATAGSERMEKR